ncbi:hypothetical protein [Tsukamurella sp. NPDC003166]|uniref:hypothetical protein n=1 Tax=Tsukamurella sp. NPDC003166 TaxID=3154444 RepID=UPI0033AC28C0
MSLGKPRWKAVPWIAALLVFMVAITGNILVPQYTVPAAVADPNGPGWPPGPGTGPGTGSGSGQQGAVPGKVAPQAPVNPGQVAPDPAVSPNTGNTGNSGNTGPNAQSPNIPNPPANGKPIFNGDQGQQQPAQPPNQQPSNTSQDNTNSELSAREQREAERRQRLKEKREAAKCEYNEWFSPKPDGKFDDESDKAKYQQFRYDAEHAPNYTSLGKRRTNAGLSADIDHIIPLKRLWQMKGFKGLPPDVQVAIADNPSNLMFVRDSPNRSKQDGLASEYGEKPGWNASTRIDGEFTVEELAEMCRRERAVSPKLHKLITEAIAEHGQAGSVESNPSSPSDAGDGSGSNPTTVPLETTTIAPTATPTEVTPTTQAPYPTTPTEFPTTTQAPVRTEETTPTEAPIRPPTTSGGAPTTTAPVQVPERTGIELPAVPTLVAVGACIAACGAVIVVGVVAIAALALFSY